MAGLPLCEGLDQLGIELHYGNTHLHLQLAWMLFSYDGHVIKAHPSLPAQ